jgi:SAM-dependent methyltransferase
MGYRLRSFLGSEYVRSWVFRLRRLYYMRLRKQLRMIESEDAFKVTVEHNLKYVPFWSPRMELLIRPLSVIESLAKDARILIIGPRNEYDLLLLAAHGFSLGHIRGLDLISYSPWIDLGDMHAMPYADNSWDAVLCGWTLSYSATPNKAAAEILRIVRDGGMVAIGVEYSTLNESDEKALGGYAIQERNRLAERVNSVDQILELFAPHVKEVFFRHDAPLKISHTRDGLAKNCSNVAVVFSVSKTVE